MILGNVAITTGTAFGNFNDPNYNNVGLLLTGAAGTNGATNNTFLDSSPYGQTVTRNGDVTQGGFTPYLGTGYYGAYFDGTGDFLSCGTNSGFAMGSGDFTWEAWIYFPSGSSFRQIFSTRATNGATTISGSLAVNPSNGLTWFTSVAVVDYTTSIGVNQWVHVAVCRSGTTLRVFANGVQVGSATNSDNLTRDTFSIGANNDGTEPFAGYISNVRVVKGTALYTSAFIPSTAPLTAVTNTTLLACQSNRFIDNSPNNFTITRNGDTRVVHFNPFTWNGGPYNTTFNGGSMYFDGTGDYLSLTSNTAFAAPGDFTVEFWAYTPSVASQTVFYLVNATNGLIIYTVSSKVVVRSFGVADLLTSSINMPLNQWVHIAAARSGTTLSLWINGSRTDGGTVTNSTSFAQGELRIGNNETVNAGVNGYISNVRFVKGTAVYTSNFTPPTQPLQPIFNTTLLLNGTNAGIVDRSENNNLVTVADARLSTTQIRYNPTSIFFDGTGDALHSPWNPSLEFGAGNFTIEFWAYVVGGNSIFCWSADFHYGMTFNYGGATSNRVGFWASSNGTTWNMFNADGGGNGVSTGTITNNTWTYVTLVRNGSSWTLYLNGTSAWTGTSSATIITRSTDTFRIGGPWPGAGPTNLNGYIDDFRITPGVARYTANFTPPTYSPLGF